jgi:hypothetical protein
MVQDDGPVGMDGVLVEFDDERVVADHPVVGDITLTHNRTELSADPGQMLMIWTAEPGSKSAEALSLLGSWAATLEQREPQDVPDHL